MTATSVPFVKIPWAHIPARAKPDMQETDRLVLVRFHLLHVALEHVQTDLLFHLRLVFLLAEGRKKREKNAERTMRGRRESLLFLIFFLSPWKTSASRDFVDALMLTNKIPYLCNRRKNFVDGSWSYNYYNSNELYFNQSFENW